MSLSLTTVAILSVPPLVAAVKVAVTPDGTPPTEPVTPLYCEPPSDAVIVPFAVPGQMPPHSNDRVAAGTVTAALRTKLKPPAVTTVPAGMFLLLFWLVENRTLPVAFSPTFFSPVAVKSTVRSCFCSCLTARIIPLSTSVSPSRVNWTFRSTVTAVVLAVITTVARGANQIAQTKNATKIAAPPPISAIFLRNEEKFGTFVFFFLSFFRSFGFSDSAITASTAGSSWDATEAACSPTGKAPPSMTSSSSTLSAGISTSSGLLCKLRATGIFAEAAKATSDWL